MFNIDTLSYEECLALHRLLLRGVHELNQRLTVLRPVEHPRKVAGPSRNVVILMNMRVGETRVINGHMHHATRQGARKRMEAPEAQWSTRRLGNGSVRVTRTR